MSGGGAPASDEGGGEGGAFGEAAAEDVELNLTALMDILSNLLFFLLASFGATLVLVINASVPVQSEGKSDVADTPQSITLTVELRKDRSYEVGGTGTAQSAEELKKLTRVIPAKAGDADYQAFAGYLVELKQRYPRSETMVLAPEPGVPYEVMIGTMDAARERVVGVGVQRHVVKLFPTVVVASKVK